MDVFSSMIARKFKNIAGERYEEIMSFYREFLLSEEEMSVPSISAVLMPLDRSTVVIPEKVYEFLSTYEGSILLLYVIDVDVIGIIEGTLGEEEAEVFKRKELEEAYKLLSSIELKLSGFNFSIRKEVVFGDKGEDVIDRARNHDLVVISKRYGSEGARSSRVSPLVFRIVHNVTKPVVVY